MKKVFVTAQLLLLLVLSLFLFQCTAQDKIEEIIDQKLIQMDVTYSSPSGSDVLSGNVVITLKVTPVPGQAIESVSGYVNSSDFMLTFTPSGNENEYSAVFDTTVLPNGEHALAVAVNNARKAFAFFVSNQENPDQNPQVSFQNLSADQVISGIYTIQINAQAKSPKTLTKVEVFAGEASLGLASFQDGFYELSWNTAAIAQSLVQLKAVATDSAALSAECTVSVQVVNDAGAPSVTLLAPSGVVSGQVQFKAQAEAKGVSSISKVEFFVQDQLVGKGTLSNGFYLLNWATTSLADGTYALKAVATDNTGKTGEDASKSITIQNNPSSIAFAEPQSSSVSGTVLIKAAASADIKKVKFSINNNLKYTATSVFEYSWNTSALENGQYTLKIEGLNSADQVLATASKTVNVSNVDQEAPLVNLTSPESGLTLEAGMRLTLSATATDNVGVTKVEFMSGEQVIDSVNQAPYTATWTLSAGSFSIKAVAYDAAGNVGTSTTVSLTVVSSANPSINITAPLDAAQLDAGNAVTISFEAADNVALEKVELFANDVKLTTITNGTTTFQWTPAKGTYTLKAVATDMAGNTATDDDTSVTVNEGFVCREFPGYVYAHVNAGRAKGELSGFTYVYKAVGSNNDLGTSAMAEVTLRETQAGYFELGSCQSIDNQAPVVNVTAPANGAVLSGNVTVSAEATDNVAVTKVEFFANTTLIAEKTAAPYTFSWNTASAANGSYALKAKASDAAGNTKEHSINITVDNGVDNTPPQVNITAPATGSTVSGSVSISVTASDDRGVARVEYFANNSPIGTVTVAPFGLTWDAGSLNPGSYALKAVAYDGAGNSAVDNDTTVTVEAGGAEYDKTNGLVKLSGSYTGLNNVYKYIPAGMKSNVAYPLVVVAHGCLETAQEHSNNSEWTKLADTYKFFLIYPEETSQIGKCLDWWTATSQNGGGDTGSTIQAVKDLMGAKSLCSINGTATKCKVDTNKVFVNGFSAGGGLAIQMLAVAPTLFKKGAIHAGVPYKGYTGSDTNSLGYINGGKNQTPAQWAALMPHNPGTYPPILVFHGEGDTTVNYTFMNEIMEQWTEVHGIDRTADNNGSKLKAGDPNHTYNEYHDANGNIVVATVSIKGKGTMKMGHRVAVDPNGTGVDKGGNSAGTYAEDAGLYAAYYALKFFGIIP